MAWRQQLIESGAVSRKSFKEAHLRLVLRSGRTDVAQIRAMLPGSVAEHAEDMARLLAELENQSGHAAESGTAASRQRTEVEEARLDAGADSRLFRPARPDEPAPRHTDELHYRAGDFAAFASVSSVGEVHTIGLRRRRRGEDTPGALELTWPPYPPADRGPETVVIYRVVSEEDNPPYSPDRAHLVVGTTATSATGRTAAARRGAPLPGVGQHRAHPRPGAGRLSRSNTPRPCWSARCATSRFARTTGRSSAGGTSRQR